MERIRRFVVSSVAIPIIAIAASATLPGCSNDSTVVAQGDPAARRKEKDDAMKKKMGLNGDTASAPTGKGSSKRKAGPPADSF
jgi:hypothetical protein